jgi:hypothetical protein
VTKPLEQKSGHQPTMMETKEKEPQWLLEIAVTIAKEVAATATRETTVAAEEVVTTAVGEGPRQRRIRWVGLRNLISPNPNHNLL